MARDLRSCVRKDISSLINISYINIYVSVLVCVCVVYASILWWVMLKTWWKRARSQLTVDKIVFWEESKWPLRNWQHTTAHTHSSIRHCECDDTSRIADTTLMGIVVAIIEVWACGNTLWYSGKKSYGITHCRQIKFVIKSTKNETEHRNNTKEENKTLEFSSQTYDYYDYYRYISLESTAILCVCHRCNIHKHILHPCP